MGIEKREKSRYKRIVRKFALTEFYKPVDMRLNEYEFNQIPRRVMGEPLKKELGLDEFPNCPICMDEIGSRQHWNLENLGQEDTSKLETSQSVVHWRVYVQNVKYKKYTKKNIK